MLSVHGTRSAFSAFPDTSLFAEGSIAYSFKIREATPIPSREEHGESTTSYFATLQATHPVQNPSASSSSSTTPVNSDVPLPRTPSSDDMHRFGPASPQTPAANKILMSKGETAEDYRKWDERGREWTYGFVWFEQRKDISISRGYMQVWPAVWHLVSPADTDALKQLSYLAEHCHLDSAPVADAILQSPFGSGTCLLRTRACGARNSLSCDCKMVRLPNGSS
jgi:hypothetical protein